jgi:hypothetical protein
MNFFAELKTEPVLKSPSPPILIPGISINENILEREFV